MHVKLSTALSNEGKHAKVSPEMLEMMGKQAANIFLEKNISLNESISKLAAAHDNINQEQIKRVCEFANTAVYLAKHDMAKTAGEKSSYPEFDLADPNRVVQDLSDGTKSTVTTKVDADYSKLPTKMKVSSANAEAALEELFTSKTAEDLDYSQDSAINEVMAAKDQLKGLQGHLTSACEQFDMMFKESSAEFYELSKRHMMDGGSLVDLVKAAQATGASEADVGQVIAPVIKKLVHEKVASPKDLKEQMRSLEKVAHRSINPDHPLVKAAGAIITSVNECNKTVQGLTEVEAGLKQVNAFIKEKLSAGATRQAGR